MNRGEAGWIAQYQQMNALWMHDGNPKRPHALLTSGQHSGGFFNSSLVMEDPVVLDHAAIELVTSLAKAGLVLSEVDRVVGPAMGAITLAHDVCRHISYMTGRHCLCAYAEKIGEGKDKEMRFNRTVIRPDEKILLVEDVVTTGSSLALVAEAVTVKGGEVLPFDAALVNRSGLKMNGERTIVSLIDRHLPSWLPEDCPLCTQGSVAIPPKKPVENWVRLNATYS
ncbi:hypothetical protein K8Q93_00215 [Candidatus Parcubacteria bacterium]|nr:hypothetical protein [Candidatus Parcubacteria bacterium]